ncbi:membrane protein, partial [Hoeflea sp. BAL378]
MLPPPWINFTVALAIGLLIGLERERSKGEGPLRRAAGIRTFALASLAGAVSVHVGGIPLLALVVGAVTLLTALSYLKGSREDPGLTTEIGLLLMPLVGALAMADTLVAGALAACIAVVLAMKRPIHRFVTGVMTDEEVGDGLIFAIATLVIWPLLPDRFLGPLDAVNLHKVWLLVVLILAIGAAGHVAMRLLGLRFGLAVAGFASGFVSSLATI